MNENLMNGIKHIIAGQGEEPLTDAARFRPILAEYVPDAPRPLAAALGNCVENGAYTALKTAWGAAERAARKAVLVQRLHGEYGLDGALAGEALDILETALFDAESVPEQPPAPESTPAVPPGPAVSVPEPVPPRGARPQCVKTLKRPAVIAAGAALVLALGTVWGILPAYWNNGGPPMLKKKNGTRR